MLPADVTLLFLADEYQLAFTRAAALGMTKSSALALYREFYQSAAQVGQQLVSGCKASIGGQQPGLVFQAVFAGEAGDADRAHASVLVNLD